MGGPESCCAVPSERLESESALGTEGDGIRDRTGVGPGARSPNLLIPRDRACIHQLWMANRVTEQPWSKYLRALVPAAHRLTATWRRLLQYSGPVESRRVTVSPDLVNSALSLFAQSHALMDRDLVLTQVLRNRTGHTPGVPLIDVPT